MSTSISLVGQAVEVVLIWDSGMPRIAHWGQPLDGPFNPDLLDRPVPNAVVDVDPLVGLIVEEATGFTGHPGIGGHRADGTGWSPRFALQNEPVASQGLIRFDLSDPVAKLDLSISITLTDTDALVLDASVTNTGTSNYSLSQLTPSLPIPTVATELLSFGGRWCLEFQPRRSPLHGLTVVENRTGRSSQFGAPAFFVGSAGFGEQTGEVWGAQLAWSGNYRLAAERNPDGRQHVQLGELLHPGEIDLEAGQTYRAPSVVGAYSAEGLSAASNVFHRYVRQLGNQPGPAAPRPVTLNIWEAVYFDHDLTQLKRLADVAASVGVERYVLDDGWFASRRDDTSGLGDWWVSAEAWPNGLGPFIDHVAGLGMEFGLWFEPESFNPDSDLYRAHPEWALTTDGYDAVLARQQLVLDVGRPEVRDYLFDKISAILAAHTISYVKWDFNRNVVQGSGGDGRPGTHRHIAGLYQLLSRLRAAHPEVEIESCASGGGRVDLGILAHSERVWASDCNDALDRQRIQRGFSMAFPPEIMGSHLGADIAHTTGRHQPLGFRLATALFGHFGIEWNLLGTDPAERNQISAATALYKRLRRLLHTGTTLRVDHDDPSAIVHGVVAADRADAIFAYVQLASGSTTIPLPMRFAGLDPDRTYELTTLDELMSAREFGRSKPRWMTGPQQVSGRQLMTSGLQPPVLHPESVLLLQLSAR